MNKIHILKIPSTKSFIMRIGGILAIVFASSLVANAQDGDYYEDDYSNYYEGDSGDNYSGSDYSGDSDNGSGDFSYGSFGKSKREDYVEKKVVYKPYIRYIPPYDSIRELVMYKAVVDVKDRDGYEVELDTINFRAHQWLEVEFGKNLKKFLTSDALNESAGETEHKIVIHGTFPCEIQPNEFTTIVSGQVEYDMEIRVRDGRYRYTVKNLVHIADPIPGAKEGEKTYFEYLMKTKDDVRAGDRVLIAADKKINTMMAALQKTCQTAPLQEEDDW